MKVAIMKGKQRPVGYVTTGGFVKTAKGWRKATKKQIEESKKKKPPKLAVKRPEPVQKKEVKVAPVNRERIQAEKERLGVSEGYVPYTAAGTHSVYSFIKWTIQNKRGVSKEKKKQLVGKLDRIYYSPNTEDVRKELFRIAEKVGGQKAFERYVDKG